MNDRTSNRLSRNALAKVPAVTGVFWLAKILTTGMGETTSDFMNQRLGPGIAVPIMLLALAGSLVVQFRMKRYVPWAYWLVVVMVAVFGTTAADALHVVLGIPYLYSTTFYAIVLAVIFSRWRSREGTLSIHSIYTRTREKYYWSTVLATFALGTAAGDLTATPLHLGYLASGLMFGAIILVPAIAYRVFHISEVLAFWFAYVVTRPLGASFADWIAVPKHKGGLGVGPGMVSLVLAVAIVGVVGYLSVTHTDVDVALRAEPIPAVD